MSVVRLPTARGPRFRRVQLRTANYLRVGTLTNVVSQRLRSAPLTDGQAVRPTS